MDIEFLTQPSILFALVTFIITLLVSVSRDFALARETRPLFYKDGVVPPGTTVMRIFVFFNSFIKALATGLLAIFTFTLNAEGGVVALSVGIFLLACMASLILVLGFSSMIGGQASYWSLYRFSVVFGLIFSFIYASLERRMKSFCRPLRRKWVKRLLRFKRRGEEFTVRFAVTGGQISHVGPTIMDQLTILLLGVH